MKPLVTIILIFYISCSNGTVTPWKVLMQDLRDFSTFEQSVDSLISKMGRIDNPSRTSTDLIQQLSAGNGYGRRGRTSKSQYGSPPQMLELVRIIAEVIHGYIPKRKYQNTKQVSQSLDNLKQQLKAFVTFSFERSLVCTKMTDLLDKYGLFLQWNNHDESVAKELISQCLTKKFVSSSYGRMYTPHKLTKMIGDMIANIRVQATNLKEATVSLKKVAKQQEIISRSQKNRDEKRLRELTREIPLLRGKKKIKEDEVSRKHSQVDSLNGQIRKLQRDYEIVYATTGWWTFGVSSGITSAVIKPKINRKRDQIQQLQNQIDDLNGQINELKYKIKSLENEKALLSKMSEADYKGVEIFADKFRVRIESLLDRLTAVEKYSKEVADDVSHGGDSEKILMLKPDMKVLHAEFVELKSFRL